MKIISRCYEILPPQVKTRHIGGAKIQKKTEEEKQKLTIITYLDWKIYEKQFSRHRSTNKCGTKKSKIIAYLVLRVLSISSFGSTMYYRLYNIRMYATTTAGVKRQRTCANLHNFPKTVPLPFPISTASTPNAKRSISPFTPTVTRPPSFL